MGMSLTLKAYSSLLMDSSRQFLQIWIVVGGNVFSFFGGLVQLLARILFYIVISPWLKMIEHVCPSSKTSKTPHEHIWCSFHLLFSHCLTSPKQMVGTLKVALICVWAHHPCLSIFQARFSCEVVAPKKESLAEAEASYQGAVICHQHFPKSHPNPGCSWMDCCYILLYVKRLICEPHGFAM